MNDTPSPREGTACDWGWQPHATTGEPGHRGGRPDRGAARRLGRSGGGALLTPILILQFGVTPSAAVSNSIVASAVMRPVGGAIHFRRGTVHLGLVGWLSLGSLPAWAFIDGRGRPDAAWRAVGHQRRKTLALVSLGTPVGVGLVTAAVYFARMRPRILRATEQNPSLVLEPVHTAGISQQH